MSRTKGTTTDGSTILLTANEVQHALATSPQTALAIARGIVLHDAGTANPYTTGGILDVFQPWRPLDTDLKAIGYTYTLPPPGSPRPPVVPKQRQPTPGGKPP